MQINCLGYGTSPSFSLIYRLLHRRKFSAILEAEGTFTTLVATPLCASQFNVPTLGAIPFIEGIPLCGVNTDIPSNPEFYVCVVTFGENVALSRRLLKGVIQEAEYNKFHVTLRSYLEHWIVPDLGDISNSDEIATSKRLLESSEMSGQSLTPPPLDPSPNELSIALPDYGLSDTGSSLPISYLSLRDFIAMCLQARRMGRTTRFLQPWSVTSHGNTVYTLSFQGRIIEGFRMRGFESEKVPKPRDMRTCPFGCMRNDVHQWLSSTQYVPLLQR